MKVQYYLKKMRQLPPEQILKHGYNFLCKKSWYQYRFMRDTCRSTYASANLYRIEAFGACETFAMQPQQRETLFAIAALYCEHFFDLLGSGWTKVSYGMECRGLEGYRYSMSEEVKTDAEGKWLEKRISKANLPYAKRIWRLIGPEYVPIDWQLDFKSGYRWSEQTWYMRIAYGDVVGADVKVPWELARMQHLPTLAQAYLLAKESEKEKYAKEFCNQTLDFIALNPPRFGVNWRCTMDVGIRVANWLTAYDLFKSAGAEFTLDFEEVFASSVYAHGKHIIQNLEYSPRLCSNHYLSDVAGLLFAAAHLLRSGEVDAWLAFAVQELIGEMGKQFHEDGTNFEGSTSYHRLSTEIMLYSAVLCLGLKEEKIAALRQYQTKYHQGIPKLKTWSKQLYDVDDAALFPTWFWERLEKACAFSVHLKRPDGLVPQFGDNDSGRFIKMNPIFAKMTVREAKKKYQNLVQYAQLPDEAIYYDENILDHRHLTNVAAVLYKGNPLFSPDAANIESVWIRGLTGGMCIHSYYLKEGESALWRIRTQSAASATSFSEQFAALPLSQRVYRFTSEQDLTEGLQVYQYAGMGVYIFKSDALYIAVRCGELGQDGNGGHCHNDQLSAEIYINGQAIIQDPGTYVYTPLPKLRNQYRSTRSHFTPWVQGQEQNPWALGRIGLFSLLSERTRSECLYLASDGIAMRHDGFGAAVYRVITLDRHAVTVSDFGSKLEHYEKAAAFSSGYGKLTVVAQDEKED